MYRTVTDGPDGYIYGEWMARQAALDEAQKLNLKDGLTWVEDSEHNIVR